ncbi:serine/threonine protein kinase [Enhygromyxa salina]|uniref:non-specific serine/threonine protein kinase n=2 Tax=Enhygromyxa salina TaxID=215803 RepID=A0A0C2D4Q2_9BACT|nr:serine/threonine protein kinase [Enhygromyxa salina]
MIGAGGMGEVWAAHRRGASDHEVLAVKCLPERLADVPAFRQILLEEARLAMLLRHPNIVHVFDAAEVAGQAYIAMEFVHGLDLARLRKYMAETGERLAPQVIAYVIGEILTGLDYAHNLVHEAELLSLVHRDISPHNVMLSVEGEVKLTDFGVARLSSEDTSGTHVKGKARYMPPEQLRGESRSPAVDLFAAGAVLHEMLDGSVFRGEGVDDARLLGMALNGSVPAPKHPREIPRTLERLRRGLLAADPRQRIRSAAEALELLQAWTGYRDAGTELAQVVMRYLERQTGLAQQPTQTGLAHQATFLQTNEIRIEDADDFLALDGLPNESMLSAPVMQAAKSGVLAVDAQDHGAGLVQDLEHDLVHAPDHGRHGVDEDGFVIDDPIPRAPTGGHRSVPAFTGSPLQLDMPARGPSIARQHTTSHNPVVSQGRSGAARWLIWIIGVLAVGAAAVFGGPKLMAWLDARADDPLDAAPADDFGLRKARVIGDDHPSHAGFRHHRMDKLATDDILYEYTVTPGPDATEPLAMLAAGEAEFALMRLDQLLRAPADALAGAKIVAVVAVSVGADGLVLDSVEHPSLRSLEDLAKLGRKLEHPVVLAYASASPGASLELRLDALLSAIAQPTVQRSDEPADARSVYDALAAEASDDAPIVAAMLSEPWLSQARDAGMTVAVSTADLPTTVIHLLIASERTLASGPELVSAVVGRAYEVVDAQHSEPAEREALIQQLVTSSGLSAAEAGAALLGLCRPDAAGALPWLLGTDDKGPLLSEAVEATWATLRARDLVTGPSPSRDSLNRLIDARALMAAAEGREAKHACAPAPTVTADQSARPLGELALPVADTSWFNANEPALSNEHTVHVDDLVVRLRSFNPATVTAVITGYGDDRGDKSRALGQARAKALVERLQSAGVEMQLAPRGASASAGPPAQLRISLATIGED